MNKIDVVLYNSKIHILTGKENLITLLRNINDSNGDEFCWLWFSTVALFNPIDWSGV